MNWVQIAVLVGGGLLSFLFGMIAFSAPNPNDPIPEEVASMPISGIKQDYIEWHSGGRCCFLIASLLCAILTAILVALLAL